MERAITIAKKHSPAITFQASKHFSWDARTNVISYPSDHGNGLLFAHGLFHGLAHAILGHASFVHDIDLLKKERDAWAHAKQLLEKHDLVVDQDHIEDCLDTYRDWIYARASCPTCKLVGMQSDRNHYSCPHCVITWKVPASRLCAVKRTLVV